MTLIKIIVVIAIACLPEISSNKINVESDKDIDITVEIKKNDSWLFFIDSKVIAELRVRNKSNRIIEIEYPVVYYNIFFNFINKEGSRVRKGFYPTVNPVRNDELFLKIKPGDEYSEKFYFSEYGEYEIVDGEIYTAVVSYNPKIKDEEGYPERYHYKFKEEIRF